MNPCSPTILRRVVFTCAALSVAVASADESVEKQIEAKLDEIRKAGYPVTLEELDKWYALPSFGPNAADTFVDAFSRIVEVELPDRPFLPFVGDARLPARTEPLPTVGKAVSLLYLADNELALSLLHISTSVKECRYPIRLTDGSSTRLPHAQHARKAARLLAVDAATRAEDGKTELATQALLDGVAVARSLTKEPILISHLIRLACQATTLTALERVENRSPLTDNQLGQLLAVLMDIENSDGLIRAMIGERCFGISTFKMSPETVRDFADGFFEEPEDKQKLIEYLITPSVTLSADRLAYLETMNDYVKATQTPLPARLRAASAAETKMKAMPASYRFSRMMLPAVTNAIIKDARSTASLRAAQTSLAIERFRLATNKLPESLANLVPAYLKTVPADPFDDQPLRYKKLDKGYVVYSIGDDLKDNGGAEKDANGKTFTVGTDIPFTVER